MLGRLRTVLSFALALAMVPVSALAQDSTADATADVGTHPDEGLMIAGGSLFLLSLTLAEAVVLPIQMGHCFEPGSTFARGLPADSGYANCSQAPMTAIPFAHVLGGGIDAVIGGSVLMFGEVIGLFIFIGGAAHHHPNTPPGPTITFASVPGADLGLAVALHL